MSTPTIKDVAKLAGVSISTVSRVMNDSKPVSPESRRKVQDAIEKLDFKRNELARSLVMQRSNVIGVVVKDIGIPYMANIVRGVEEIGRMYKYDILLSSSYGDLDLEKNLIDFLIRKKAEAILIISEFSSSETRSKLESENIPYLQIDRYSKGHFNTVTIDFEKASYDICKYLIDLGHEKILFINNTENLSISDDKMSGYENAINENNLKTFVLRTSDKNIKTGFNLGEKIKDKILKDGISAIYASDDNLGIGIINYFYKEGIRVPEDISLVGFGNTGLASQYTPSLTTLSEPYYDIGAVAMRRLVKVLQEDEKIEDTVFLPAQIIERESSKKK